MIPEELMRDQEKAMEKLNKTEQAIRRLKANLEVQQEEFEEAKEDLKRIQGLINDSIVGNYTPKEPEPEDPIEPEIPEEPPAEEIPQEPIEETTEGEPKVTRVQK